MRTKFWSNNVKGRDQSEEPGVDGEDNIRMDLRELVWEDVNWIHLAQDRDKCRAVVNTVMNHQVP